MSADQKHNELARDFVNRVVRETHTYSQMMVVIETTVLAAMLSLKGQHGFDAAGAAAMVESAVQAATERFAELEKRR